MRLRTKGYIVFIGFVMVLEVLMIYLYVDAANSFEPYQLWDVFNFTKENPYEGGIGLLLGAMVVQLVIIFYLIYQDRKLIEH